MNNNDSSSVSGETPSTETPVTGTPASPAGETPQPKPSSAAQQVSLQEALARIAELEHSQKNAVEERDRHRKKLSAYEKAEQEAKDAQLSEIERIRKQQSELQEQHAALLTQLQEARVQQAVERSAHKLNFLVPAEMVSRLIDWAEVEYEDGRPTNVEKLLEKLAKAAPELIRKPEEVEPPPSPLTPGKVTPSIPAMNPGRSQITPPDALPPGRLSIQEAYAQSKAQRQH